MSINKVECANGRLTLHGDYVVYHQDGVQFELHGDGIPGFLKGSRKGNIFITTNRVIFGPSEHQGVGSFSMNFQSVRRVEVKQPMFGANYIKGDVISEPEGGWAGRGTFNIAFNSGGAIEFAEHFRKAVASARPGSRPMPPVGQHDLVFGVYNNPPPPPQPGYYNGPPYAGYYGNQAPGYYGPPPQPGYYGGPPPPGGYYATQPPQYAPPEHPPPYPGQAASPSAPPPDFPGVGGTKAQEAYSSGHNAYVPANQPPPPYSAENKKDV